MLIYLYSRNLGLRGGGVISSLTTKKYVNLFGHECLSFTNINELRSAIIRKRPDLILHHNIVNMYSVLRISKKYKIPLIITVNGLITCGRGFHYMPDKSGFGKVCKRCSVYQMLKCSIIGEKGIKDDLFLKIKKILSVVYRWLKIKLRIYCLNKVDAIIAIDETLKKVLIRGGIRNKIYVCPQPIDDDFLKVSKKVVKADGEELQRNEKAINHFFKTKKKKIILGAGLFVEKGALVFLKAFNELQKEGEKEKKQKQSKVQDVEVFVIGKKHEYVDLSVFKPYMKKNVFVTGKVSLDEMKLFYKNADFMGYICLLPGAFGRVWVEAIMHKCAILCVKNRGGPNDFLVPNKEALFVNENIEALKKGIVKLLDDDKFRKKIAINGYKYAKNNLVASVVVKRLDEIYKDVVKD